jgi:hypothetical protein
MQRNVRKEERIAAKALIKKRRGAFTTLPVLISDLVAWVVVPLRLSVHHGCLSCHPVEQLQLRGS